MTSSVDNTLLRGTSREVTAVLVLRKETPPPQELAALPTSATSLSLLNWIPL